MKRGMKTFARAIREADIDKADEMMDSIVQGNLDKEIWEGYRKALEGMVEALESEEDLTLPRQLAEDELTLKKIESLKNEMEEKSSQSFRPEYELGFNSAWSDVLEVMLEDEKEK